MNLIGTLVKIIPLVIGVIGAVETMYKAVTGKGKEKKDSFIAGIMAALGISEAALNKDLLTDEQTKKLEELLGNVSDAIIAANNFIRDLKKDEVVIP